MWDTTCLLCCNHAIPQRGELLSKTTTKNESIIVQSANHYGCKGICLRRGYSRLRFTYSYSIIGRMECQD
ncbi:hypothetical protein OESDEN_13125 [Oesophagostomum dentatum]|uniref:Uncharacterized protein n=1 Tax=Oesophagostomum dentatum TaxID=61180 RepID=A0A0B1SUD1_OESDE|nr:hypothetical protein OESDEN_13125 [Oesophagostomum dentatum]